MYKSLKSFIKFILYVGITIIVTYYLPPLIAPFWYIFLLILYWRSNDEPFWLAFFMVTVDGFMGFFGVYTVTIKLIPGLPAIELAQFYIILSAFKAERYKIKPYLFYNKYMLILLFYVIFLIIWGQFMGFHGELRDYFRIIKLTLPFILFYSLPRLLPDIESYKRLFGFIFFILIAGFAAQLFTLFTGFSPAKVIKLSAEQLSEIDIFDRYRGFYNIGATLIGLFGALFFIALKTDRTFNTIYLYIIIISAYGMAYLSATRGWIIAFSIIIVFTLLFVIDIYNRKLTGFIFFSILLISIGLSNTRIKNQIDFANERLLKLQALSKGDITAEGTLKRLSERGPRVIKVWKENPIFGWGFSDISRKYQDGHVGNQNLLMTSGLVGFSLLFGFLIYFCNKILQIYLKSPFYFSLKKALIVFIIFLLGWFFIHSTSGQHFNYLGIPAFIIPQAIFFSFGALIYNNVNSYLCLNHFKKH